MEDKNKYCLNDIDLDEAELSLVYVLHVGTNADGLNLYHMFYSENPDDVFVEGWAEKPAGLIPNYYMTPQDDMFDRMREIRTSIRFDLAQDSGCFSMQDCRDGCVALASENLDEAEDYPEPYRLVFMFGEPEDEVERKLAGRNILSDII